MILKWNQPAIITKYIRENQRKAGLHLLGSKTPETKVEITEDGVIIKHNVTESFIKYSDITCVRVEEQVISNHKIWLLHITDTEPSVYTVGIPDEVPVAELLSHFRNQGLKVEDCSAII